MVAVPFVTVTGEPMAVAPSMNLTVPVIVPAPVELTFAVNTTACPWFAEVGEADSTVVVVAFPTCTLTGCELLVPNLLSPE